MSEEHQQTKKEVSDELPQAQTVQDISKNCAESELEKNLADDRKAVAGTSVPSTSAGVCALTRIVSPLQHAFTLGSYPKVLRYAPSFAQLSKRPLNCPATKCQKLFASNQIIQHISYEHTKTPSEVMYFYQEKIVDVNPNIIVAHEVVILAMIAIPRKIMSTLVNQHQEISYVYLVFGTKLPLSSSTNSLVNIWVSGYMAELFSCTVELFSEDRSFSNAYHGDINSLRDSNKTIDIFNRAKCLLVHSSSVDRMTSNETFTMKLKISITCKNDGQ